VNQHRNCEKKNSKSQNRKSVKKPLRAFLTYKESWSTEKEVTFHTQSFKKTNSQNILQLQKTRREDMKKLITLLFLCVAFAASSLLAQDHLLITEFAVTPTSGEFIEIYNPTADSIDLTDYYITDATFAGGGTFYYQIVEGGGGGGDFFDFNARFPEGAKIGPGEYQTIAIAGDEAFFNTYNVLPTYELYEDSTAFANDVPDMREATTG
ncbi:MAG: hypothetical protein CUN57_00810, partial [Phototrophicales bacterium]